MVCPPQLPYGFTVLGGGGVATPHAGWSRAGEGARLRLGQRLRVGRASEWRIEGTFADDGRQFMAGYGYRLGDGLDVGVEATRHESANDEEAGHEVQFRASVRW